MADDLPFASAEQTATTHAGHALMQQPEANTIGGREMDDENLVGTTDRGARPVVKAHQCALQAEDAARRGEYADAMDLHLGAAKRFLMAAEHVQEHGVLASALLLLADSHAARAEEASIRLRLSRGGSRSRSSRRDLTPAEAYRAAASGSGAESAESSANRGTPRRGADHPALNAVMAPNMDDSIMRGPLARNTTGAADSAAAGDAVAELAVKFRPQRDDLLELERQLSKLGLESRMGGPGGRSRHRPGAGNPSAQLSSALGESFCLLNQSVIFGGGVGAAPNAIAGTSLGGGPPKPPLRLHPQSPPPVPSEASTEAGRNAAARMKTHGDGSLSGRSASDRGGRTDTNGVVSSGGLVHGRRGALEGSLSGRTEASAADGKSVGGGPGVGQAVLEDSRGKVLPREDGRQSIPDESRRNPPDDATQEGEIMRLLTCLKTLGDENVSLMKECEDRDKVRQESEAMREEMKRFQLKYQERFTLLKKTLDEIVRSYPLLGGPGVGMGASAGPGADGARVAEEANRKLTAQVKKYEKYYLELCQKADSKRKEQLAQAKAARQQQLAHHQSFGQQHQASQQQQQPQRRRSPAPSSRHRHGVQGPSAAPHLGQAQPQQQQRHLIPQHPHHQALPQASRTSPAPNAQQQQHIPHLGVQPYPAFSQQLRHSQQQRQQQLGRASSGSAGLPSYRGVAQSPVSAAVRGQVAGMTRPPTTPVAPNGGGINRPAGLDDESEV